MAIDTHYYGKGQIYLAERLTPTTLGPSLWVGDVSAFTFKLAVEKVEHKESWSGQNALTDSFVVGKTATYDMTMHQVSAENLARVVSGSVVTTVAGSVVSEPFDKLAEGDVVALGRLGITKLAITDSNAAPKTLIEGIDYTLDAAFGRVTILNLAGYTAPFKRAYSYASTKAVGMFTAAQRQYTLRYEGINLADNGAPVVVELYKVSPDPLQELALVSTGNDVAGMQVTGGVLLDTTKGAAGPLGQFGAITLVTMS